MNRQRILALADEQRVFVTALRRHLHQHPELSFEEFETSAFLAERLREVGYEPRTGLGRAQTGLMASLEGGRPGPTVALRADIDALPVDEANDLPFRSQTAGVMHACGHDAHTAMLVGTARALMAAREEVPGRVVFLFQHAEELPPGGAVELIAAGALEGVDAVFGLHQGTDLEVGQMAFGGGPRQASVDNFRLTIHGVGGHGAMPHRAVDAVQVAAQVVTALHQIVSRRVPALEPAVLTIGTLRAGTKENIIAHEAVMTGTVRTLDPDLRASIPREIETVARGVAGAWGATCSIDYEAGYPIVVNDYQMAEVARRAAEIVLGPGRALGNRPPIMASEDFAHYLAKTPGCFGSIGVRTPGAAGWGSSHSGAFMLDEEALPLGVAFYLSLVTNFDALRSGVSR